MYMQLLAKAVAKLRGRPIEQPKELKLEVDAHLPAAYVPQERLRLEAYRRGGARLFPVDDLSEFKRVRLDRPERPRVAS